MNDVIHLTPELEKEFETKVDNGPNAWLYFPDYYWHCDDDDNFEKRGPKAYISFSDAIYVVALKYVPNDPYLYISMSSEEYKNKC